MGGLTREELADELDLDVEAVHAWERGEDLPTLPQFFSLAELFGWPKRWRTRPTRIEDPAHTSSTAFLERTAGTDAVRGHEKQLDPTRRSLRCSAIARLDATFRL